ncbi:MAG TPA: hypothetical protein VN650_17670, partial [Gemmatimonadaceae bacterium]|nr:hypothetical protein [Gemmatimonadaceae bacterium]
SLNATLSGASPKTAGVSQGLAHPNSHAPIVEATTGYGGSWCGPEAVGPNVTTPDTTGVVPGVAVAPPGLEP